MISIVKKFFKKNNNQNPFSVELTKLKDETQVTKIFKSISDFSDESEIRYVGGCIRKILNNEKVDDIDLATNIKPHKVCEVLKKDNISFYESGIEHGTITAKINNRKFEITSLRKDISTDGRYAKVEFSNDWYEDASRRDFTFNSIYSDLNGNLYDPFNGKIDLENGLVKFIGDAEKRIKEDYLRILRYIRFYLNYSKQKHSEELKKTIRKNLNGIAKISSDRLLDELKKLVLSKGFLTLPKDNFSLEIINLVIPQLKNIKFFKNSNYYSKKLISSKDFIFLVSLMIIDETDNCEYFLYKFNISNYDKKRIRFLAKYFSKTLEKNLFTEKNLWKIFYYNGKEYLNDLIDFYIIKNNTSAKKLVILKEFFSNKSAPKLNVNAKFLMQKFHLKEGKELGKKLKDVEEFWLNNSFSINEKQIEKIIGN